MKIAEQEFKHQLIEMYQHYFQKARDATRHHNLELPADPEAAYEMGKQDGGQEACGAIFLMCFGGAEMYSLWQMELGAGDAAEAAEELLENELKRDEDGQGTPETI